MILKAIASGSNGNCFVVHNEEFTILFDAGINRGRIIEGLVELNIDPESLSYVFITHAHSDHIMGLPVLHTTLDFQVVATPGTIHELQKLTKYDSRYEEIANKAISLNENNAKNLSGLTAIAFKAIHDIKGAAGYTIRTNKENISISYTTDNARIVPEFKNAMSNSEVIIIEANHDQNMLQYSRRSFWLKNRIRATHMSNRNMVKVLQQVINERTQVVFLAHLSGECNEIAILGDQMIRLQNFLRHRKKIKNKWTWVICPRYESSCLASYDNTFSFIGGINDLSFNIEDFRLSSTSFEEYLEARIIEIHEYKDLHTPSFEELSKLDDYF